MERITALLCACKKLEAPREAFIELEDLSLRESPPPPPVACVTIQYGQVVSKKVCPLSVFFTEMSRLCSEQTHRNSKFAFNRCHPEFRFVCVCVRVRKINMRRNFKVWKRQLAATYCQRIFLRDKRAWGVVGRVIGWCA
jgi:hypothetical protein